MHSNAKASNFNGSYSIPDPHLLSSLQPPLVFHAINVTQYNTKLSRIRMNVTEFIKNSLSKVIPSSGYTRSPQKSPLFLTVLHAFPPLRCLRRTPPCSRPPSLPKKSLHSPRELQLLRGGLLVHFLILPARQHSGSLMTYACQRSNEKPKLTKISRTQARRT